MSYLVEKFQLPFTESFALRLDSRLKYDSNTTFHGIIGIDDPGLSSKFEYDKSKVGITVSDVIDLLGGRLDPRSLGIIRQLLDDSGSTHQLNISSEDLLLAIPQIQERLEVLVKKYEREGRIVIPKRPIIYVKLKPIFLIQFGTRNYSGNPLAFFRDNLDTYGRMSRSELERFDQGLYSALKRANQLGLAIPETKIIVRPPPTKKQIDEIIAAHQKYAGNATEAGKHEFYSQSTFLKYWRAAGLKILPGGHPLSQEGIDQLLSAYSVYGGNARHTSRNLGYDHHTIHKYWNKSGLRVIGKPNDTK